MVDTGSIAEAVRLALEPFQEIRFAVVFGSAAAGRLREDSDVDVAVYGDSQGSLEIEAERELDAESEIQLALERAVDRNVDLLLLNRAPATVCAAAVSSGVPVLMRDGYRRDLDARRSIDRWVETLISAAIDIGKIVLASLHRAVPQTCGQILADLEALPEFAHLSARLRPLAALRNLMAHEYLDLRWSRVKDFASIGSTAIAELAATTRAWLATQPRPL